MELLYAPPIAKIEDCHSDQVRVTIKCIEECNDFYLQYGIDLSLITNWDEYHRANIAIHRALIAENTRRRWGRQSVSI
jgi:hypothetical protein